MTKYSSRYFMCAVIGLDCQALCCVGSHCTGLSGVMLCGQSLYWTVRRYVVFAVTVLDCQALCCVGSYWTGLSGVMLCGQSLYWTVGCYAVWAVTVLDCQVLCCPGSHCTAWTVTIILIARLPSRCSAEITSMHSGPEPLTLSNFGGEKIMFNIVFTLN